MLVARRDCDNFSLDRSTYKLLFHGIMLVVRGIHAGDNAKEATAPAGASISHRRIGAVPCRSN